MQQQVKRGWWMIAALMGLACLLLTSPVLAQPRPMTDDIFTPLSQGYDFMKAGKADLAKMEFEKVVKLDRYNPFALNNLAVLSERQGNLKEAMAYLLDAETHAEEYLEKPDELCDIGGICMAIKPSKMKGGKSSIAPLVHGNINLLKIKIGKEKY
jgi:Tfp pilus assembly protein PilF